MKEALYSDTHLHIEALQIKIVRSMPAWKKLSVVDELNEMVKMMAMSGLKERHPEATPQQIHRLLAELMLGPELAQKVYDRAR